MRKGFLCDILGHKWEADGYFKQKCTRENCANTRMMIENKYPKVGEPKYEWKDLQQNDILNFNFGEDEEEVMEKRFQDCNRIEKLIRYRWYLAIPFVWFYCMIFSEKTKESARINWGVTIGMMQINMQWYHTQEEVKERFYNKHGVK